MSSLFRSISKRYQYVKRVFQAYILSKDSQLTFWHGTPKLNSQFIPGKLGQYPMLFDYKANYQGPKDTEGIPLLDYRGKIGKQHNPIAIAQYGLGNFNLFCKTKDRKELVNFIATADWLVDNLEPNEHGIQVWMHQFDWEYRDLLQAPWYSGLAQGQGISVLVRAYKETQKKKYLVAASQALEPFYIDIENGGVMYRDDKDHLWIEEYIVDPPTHILNGMIWASWGLYDYSLLTENKEAKDRFFGIVDTLVNNLNYYDIGFWSLYELSDTILPMLASPFYHQLHIVQLQIMHRITGEKKFLDYAEKWIKYSNNSIYRLFALGGKILFKFFYY